MSALRLYLPGVGEFAPDGYPVAWASGDAPVKDLVREQAGHRCVRCGHPFRVGSGLGEWSPCDERCTHRGPGRYRPGWSELGEGASGWAIVDPWSGDTATPPDATAGDLIVGGIDVEAHWRILTVHHLNGVKADLRWHNLVALCQVCHLRVQGRTRMEQVYPFEHSAWFKPYAAAYYAATYLGEELSRDETMERLDELLSLERAA